MCAALLTRTARDAMQFLRLETSSSDPETGSQAAARLHLQRGRAVSALLGLGWASGTLGHLAAGGPGTHTLPVLSSDRLPALLSALTLNALKKNTRRFVPTSNPVTWLDRQLGLMKWAGEAGPSRGEWL